MTPSPDNQHTLTEPLADIPTPLHLPNDVDGTWDFSGNQLGASSFSWTGLDASYGTDYNIGQATVAAVSTNLPNLHAPTAGLTSTADIGMNNMQHQPMITEFSADALPQLALPQLDRAFAEFDGSTLSESIDAAPFGAGVFHSFNELPAQGSCCSTSWMGLDVLDDHQANTEFNVAGIATSNSPIMNHV